MFIVAFFFVLNSQIVKNLYKKFRKANNYIKNIFVVFIIFIFTIFIAIFNYIQNPFSIFQDKKGFAQFHPYKHIGESFFYNIKFKLDNTKYTRVFVGGSSVGTSFSPYNEEPTYVVSPTWTNIYYINDVLKYFIKTHPSVKTIYYSLDISILMDKKIPYSDFDQNIKLQDYIKLLFSYSTTKYSILQLIQNIRSKYDKNYWYHKAIFPFDTPIYNGFKLSQANFDEIIEIKKYCDERNIKIIFFIPAYHSLLSIWLIENDFYNNFQYLKREIAKRVDYIDFAYSNEYTDLPLYQSNNDLVEYVPYYNIEHPYEYIGFFELERLKNNITTIGININRSNVDEILDYQYKLIEKYKLTHKDDINHFFKNIQNNNKRKKIIITIRSY